MLPPAPARQAGLRQVSDRNPGLSRRRAGRGFVYLDAAGRRLTRQSDLARIRGLAIPPAWTAVWICPHPRGHIQAVGRDARGRKQFLYHADWRAARDEAKFHRLAGFAGVLPRIRRRVARDLRRPRLDREKVLATVVRLLDTTLVRVGNESYYRRNGSVGLSTMRRRNVSVHGGVLHLAFRGKSGRHHEIDLEDPRLARIVRRLQDLPGQELFHYHDADGGINVVTSQAVNDYLHATAGAVYSAKDFRTWAGTVLAARVLHDIGPAANRRETARRITEAIKLVARRLGNTPAICRRCYVDPRILDHYRRGRTISGPGHGAAGESPGRRDLNADERAVRAFLQRRR
ncbi:MAG TPA: DNA topoisomerase IB [Opitutus sp.]|nr:DNA topoisomerase IB [Opitutus sp.]